MSTLKPIHALNLDSVQQQAFIQYFNSLAEKPLTTVRVFDRNDYYSVHGADATTAAKEVFSCIANIKKMGIAPNTLDYLVLSKGNFEILVKKLLLVRRYRVEIYAAEGSTKTINWILKYKGSPGCLSQLEEVLGDGLGSSQEQTPCLMAVNIKTDAVSKGRLLGVACVTAGDYQMSVTEFTDDVILTELETITVQMAPSECLVPQNENDDYKDLQVVMKRLNIPVTKLKKTEFATEGLIQDLNRLLKFQAGQQQDANSVPETDKSLAMTSLAAAIKYSALMTENTNFGRFRLSTIQADCFVHLDAAALAALNVLPELGASSRAQYRSIYGVLDRCRTQQGKRLLAQWLRQPLRDINLINERLDIVELLVNKSQLRLQLHGDHLRRIPDLQALARRLTRKKANLLDCYKIYQAVKRLPALLLCLAESHHPAVHSSLSEPIAELKEDLDKYLQMVETTIDMDAVDKGEFIIRPSFDTNLQRMCKEIERMNDAAQRELRRAAKDLGLEAGKTVKLESNPHIGFYLRVTRKEEQTLRENVQYRIIDALKAGLRFTSNGLEDFNEEYVSTKAAYAKEQDNIVTEIVAVAAGYSECLFCLSHILSRLDVLVAFSVAAAAAPRPYCRPTLTEHIDQFLLKDVRHPCLELQEGVSYIPNDVEFKRGTSTMHIVTGANMGGKSTWIRSCGAAALLAHAGCMVPAASALVPRLRSVSARLGASDRENKGISTFMMEMIETSAILRMATPDSLVLIDELGRGTSNYDGCGIAWAIAEELATKRKCFCLFATHYHELTRLAGLHPGAVVNSHAAVSTVGGQLVLLHKIAPGPATQSLGLRVARLAGLPDSVVAYAEDKQDLEPDKINWDTTDPQEIAEGNEIVKEFLQNCKRIHETTHSDNEMLNKINELKQQLLNMNNKYVLSILN